MMLCLLMLMLALAANSMFLPGAEAGLKYYLYPDFSKAFDKGISEVIFAAMGQAFSPSALVLAPWRSSAATLPKNVH